jgi:hypothetical protein
MHARDDDKDAVAFKSEMDRVVWESYRDRVEADCAEWVFPVAVTLMDEHWEHLNFRGAVFKERVRLDSIKGGATFAGARFVGDVSVYDCRLGQASFDHCVFEQSVSLEHCDFGSTRFIGTVFRGDANIDSTTFSATATFRQAVFHAALTVHQTDFGPSNYPPTDDTEVVVADFSSVSWLKPDLVRFSSINRRTPQPFAVSFTNCSSLEGIAFTDVNWAREAGRLMLWDERRVLPVEREMGFIEGEDPHRFYRATEHEVVASAYRQLAGAFEQRRAYDLAEECFIGVMEMKRHDRTLPWWTRVAVDVYRLASHYGSSYYRALWMLLVGVLVVFPLLYVLPPFAVMPVQPPPPTRALTLRASRSDGWPTLARKQAAYQAGLVTPPIVFSVETVTFARTPGYRAVRPCGRLVAAAETVFVAGQAGLFLLALRRRFRH